MLFGSVPLSILTIGVSAAVGAVSETAGSNNSLPVVSVSSLYSYGGDTPADIRALPDYEGNFYLDISLDKAPATDENILVYYRTVDDSAVAAWGDYESVGTLTDTYVTLNKSNGYKARVTVKSITLESGFVTPAADGNGADANKIVTRRFLFELTRVEGNAVLHTPTKADERDKSELYCYLRAMNYVYQDYNAQPKTEGREAGTQKAYDEYFDAFFAAIWDMALEENADEIAKNPALYDELLVEFEEFKKTYTDSWDKATQDVTVNSIYQTMDAASAISTPHIKYKGSHSDSINLKFDDLWAAYAQSGWCDVGISINGTITRDYWDSDGDATFNLYYVYQGEKRLALTLYLEGEFDDSTFFGWEHAFEYAIEGVEAKSRDDHIDDNFKGFTVYDNDGNVAYEVRKPSNGSVVSVCNQLNSTITDGNAVKMISGVEKMPVFFYDSTAYYLKLPSDFVLADSYSYEFISDSTREKEIRWLEDVTLSFSLIGKREPMIAKDEKGNQMVTTNIEDLKEGDPLRMIVRFDRPVYINDPNDLCYITAQINGKYNVKLTLKELGGITTNGTPYYYACDTLVFEGELPAEIKNIRIDSLRNIKLEDNDEIKSYFTNKKMLGKTIKEMYGFNKDLRTAVATVNVQSTENWMKSKSVDIYVNSENASSRFNDYVTVYYQWSNSRELPEIYGSSVIFNTAVDGQVDKSVIGTGNGETYLHLKAVSGYGKEAISDAVNGTYDPNDPSAVYTPFGPFKFDNTAPTLSAKDITLGGTLKARTLSIPMPDDGGGSGLREMSLYYVSADSEDGEGILLKKFTAEDFKGDPRTLEYTISHEMLGIGVDGDGNAVSAREKAEFYWILSDRLGNTSGKTAEFMIVFDTNDYLGDEIINVGPLDMSYDTGYAQFESNTQTIDETAYIYNYAPNKNKNVSYFGDRAVKYLFHFEMSNTAFGETDDGVYGANVYFKGEMITNYLLHKQSDTTYYLFIFDEVESGRYDIRLTRAEGDSVRVSRTYSVYATDGEDDMTAVREQIERGTLLSNTVYQLSSEYSYFYYKDADGNRKEEHYGGTKQPATFSSFQKAKDYAYYRELGDIYLVQLTKATANALISGTTGYLIAKDETVTPKEGQYWIRYKSEAWTPTSGDSAWVYYYYGSTDELSEGSLSINLRKALNAVANRIASSGRSIVLTDTSLFLGSAMGDKMLDSDGMPYLLDGQIHASDEISDRTACGNVWSIPVAYAADRNIYKSDIYVGVEGTEEYREYPIVGSFPLPEDSRFQYKTYDDYHSDSEWRDMTVEAGSGFFKTISASGVYYIREMSADGVAVYAIYIDKEAPRVEFFNTDDAGNLQEIPVDGVEITEIRTKDLIINSILPSEYDRLSYVAVYKVANLELIRVYTAEELDLAPAELDDGNYYIVVSDRSGNHYTVTAKVSSTGLDCMIKETPDKFIKLTCNRKNDQILRYEIYLNGSLVTSTYAAEATFEKAGLYTIYVQDIYGNVFSEEYMFSRNYPSVTWKYLGTDGKYHVYDPDKAEGSGFVMNAVSANQFKISTAVKTRFSFSEGYEFEFIGTAPEYTKSIGTETVVTIEAGQSFTLKVYYKNHKECYTLYSGVVDVTPPSISVSADVDVLENGEYSQFDEWIGSGEISMDEIYYILREIGRRTVVNGQRISSDIIRINSSDANELSLIEIYLDGELIKRQDSKSGFEQIIVNKWGDYRIVARDTLGNVSEFTFTNGMPDGLGYYVDGDETELLLHGYLSFETVDGKRVYTKVDYGNTGMRLDVREDADVFMSVGISGGKTEIYGFRIEDGVVYPIAYEIRLDENGRDSVALTVGEALIDLKDEKFKVGTEYSIGSEGAHGVYASVDANGVVSIKVYAAEDATKIVFVNARVEFSGSYTTFVSTEISKKSSAISLKELGVQTSTDIRVNSGFTVDEEFFAGERVSEVCLYYSRLNDLDAGRLEGRANIYTANKQYTDEGFYLLVVRNLFGNEMVYRISISGSFGVTSSVTFGDGHKIYYSKDYSEKLYSNNEITLDLLDESVEYEVTLNGIAYTGYGVRREEGITYLVFSVEGTYLVTLTDSYGNTQTKHLEINKYSYTVAEDLLVGFNENALRRDEGYTNQKLSVDKIAMDAAGIYYLAVRYGDSLTVLFDSFLETPVTSEAEDLVDIIGAMGDGEYTVIIRNRYGAVVTKTIHYRSTPTLTLERTIRSKSESEVYDLDYAIALGFWSNNTLSFTTDAKSYVFTVNGSVTECPRTLVFENAGDFGSFEYNITYIDEYGFEYSFKAYLVRKSITVDIPASITGTEIGGVLNTQDDIAITFGESIYATYRRNNGEEVVYRSGDILKKDGTYRFTVTDYAGNATMLIIRKDTAVEFSFVESSTGNVIRSGSVVNSSKITFNALNKDTAYIEKVLHNGVLQTDFEGTKITGDGKWELILADKLGNKAYFCFYILTRSQNGFSYTTPYEYRITEMWYDSGDGVRVSYMSFVNHTDYTSSFDVIENGKYTVVMTSDATGITSTFSFTVNTNAPDVSLVGCEEGETTINDVSIKGCIVGDRIMIYATTDKGERLIEQIEVTSASTKMPTITEGGKYRIVVESEAGVETELTFVRKHVMNTAGSIFIMVVIGLAVVGLFAGLVYRNKSKTDD